MADCESLTLPGIDEKPGSDGSAIRVYVAVAVTVTELFELELGDVAVAVTVSDPASA